MKPFRELSRRGRLVRLKEVAAIALARYGLEEARLRFIQYNENAIYRVDGLARSRRIIRFTCLTVTYSASMQSMIARRSPPS